jgi:hypothetical protein
MTAAVKTPKKGKTIADFRNAHDPNTIVPKKIEAALKALADEGPEAWDYENEFLKRSGLSTTQFAMFREPFEPFMVQITGKNPKRIWCGTKALAAKLRALA